MLGQRGRRWVNIRPTLGQRLLFAVTVIVGKYAIIFQKAKLMVYRCFSAGISSDMLGKR